MTTTPAAAAVSDTPARIANTIFFDITPTGRNEAFRIFLYKDAVGPGGHRGPREDAGGLTRLDRTAESVTGCAFPDQRERPGEVRMADRVPVHRGEIAIRLGTVRVHGLRGPAPGGLGQRHGFDREQAGECKQPRLGFGNGEEGRVHR